jgi:hypothetical protein
MRAFYVKCRPQGADIIDLVLKYKRVFIGYPVWKKQPFDQHNIRSCMLDISTDKKLWNVSQLETKPSAQVTHNHNMAVRIKKGDLVLVPRLENGVVYVVRVKSQFELINDPLWADEYLNLRKENNLDIKKLKAILEILSNHGKWMNSKQFHFRSFHAGYPILFLPE